MGKEIDQILSFKHFENMVIHSLEQDNFRIRISKKMIAMLLKLIYSNMNVISLQFPAKNDPIIKLIEKIDPSSTMGEIEALDHTDEIILKLKTRLFVAKDTSSGNEEEILAQYVRCINCNAILTEDIAV